jgi:hypothetical protein
MPHLAAFSRQATVYRRAVASSPWTLPSHASMLTGLYPSRHRAGVTDQELISSRLTAPELLRRHGWLTAGFAGGMFCGSRFGLSQGFAVYHDPDGFEVPGDRLTDLAVAFLADAAELRPFLFVNYFDPHFPYHAPSRFRSIQEADRLGRAVPEGPIWRPILGGDGAAWTRAVIDDIPFPAEALAALQAEYRAEVAFMDEQLGRLLDSLREHQLWDEALIIAVADHGELLGEHRVLGHGGRLDPELVEVPLIVKFPHQRRAATVDDLVSIVDLFPTVLETAGVAAPAAAAGPGVPLRPVRGFPYAEHKAEVDLMFQEYAKGHPKQCVTVVRVVPVIGPGAATSGLDVLFMPVTIHILGYDPPWQFMYGPDLMKLVVTLLRERRAGVFNAGAEGTVSYSEMRRATGKPSIGLPSCVWSPLIRFSWALRIQQKSAVGGLEFLKYPILVSAEKLTRTIGFKLTYNSREAFKAFMYAKRQG